MAKTITIGETTITVTQCQQELNKNTGMLTLVITVPNTTEITEQGLFDLINGMGDDDTIICTNDEDTTTYMGYNGGVFFTKHNSDGTLYAECKCTDKYAKKISELQATIATQNTTIASQTEEIELLNETLLEAIMA